MTLECTYCGKTFKRQAWYDKHECSKMKLAKEVGDERLLSVYHLFDFWFKYNGMRKKGKGKTFSQFIHSPYFSIFIRLFQAITSVYIADSRDYLMWLSDNRIPASKWDDVDTIAKYKKIQDRRGNGLDRAIKSLEYMALFCDYKDVDLCYFFEVISVPEAVRWVESGKLSPWVLLLTDKSDDLYNRMTEEHMFRILEIIDVDYWRKRFEVSKEDTQEIVKLLTDLGLCE